MACAEALVDDNSTDRPMPNALLTDTFGHGIVCDDCHMYQQVLSSVYVNLAPLRI
jgi:hypothetical protein